MTDQTVSGKSPPIFDYPSIQKAGRKMMGSSLSAKAESGEMGAENSGSVIFGTGNKGECMNDNLVKGRPRDKSGVLGFISRFSRKRKRLDRLAFYDYDEMRKFSLEDEARRSWSGMLIL